MKISMKFSISLLLLLICSLYQAYASIGAEAAAINAIDVDCICGRDYSPVCASDSLTYSNRCLYECARNKLKAKGRSLELVRSGVCDGESLGRRHSAVAEPLVAAVAEEDNDLDSCICDRSLKPVCGSDNRTYNNACLFECKRSILARLGKVLSILRQGACN
ncbi:serine protease inhibitor dipetalogastin [Bactrocera dorsalis]|uniref:Serine protease inhibitor dipetalogastin n=1 Tax=Bactrocera dorsalis TaxID=27457 RepID=A0A6I9VBB4_BACDO|nr:serine protease inhibitor dipetalogastin [Bactrocera dorsalis]